MASFLQAFFEPTVLTNVNHTIRVMKVETFGPIIGLQKVSGDAEAVKLMNDCGYGLTAQEAGIFVHQPKVFV